MDPDDPADRSLGDALAARRAERDARLAPEEARVLREAGERLLMLQVAEFALAAGDTFPDFALPDADGRIVSSEALLRGGPLVVVFFRGGWCPFCDLAFAAYDGLSGPLSALGATLVGVVPEHREALRETRALKRVGLTLVSDVEGRLARLCGLAFELTAAHVALYRSRGIDIAGRAAGGGWSLPLPASFVVAPDATVAFAFADADYTRRAEPSALLAAVEALVSRS